MLDKMQLKKISDKEKKEVLVELLGKVIAYMERNNITYYMAYGTLLGTVRHKGFIPWDDDIDLLLPRKDFIKLLHLMEEERDILKKDNVEIIAYNEQEKSYHKRFKIADTRTVMEEFGKDRSAVFIDIFPLDGVPSKKEKYKKKILRLDNLLVLCHSGTVIAKGIKGYIYKFLLSFHKMLGLKRMEKYYENRLLKLTDFHSNSYVCTAEAGYESFDDFSNWKETIALPFESLIARCPCGYDKILKNWYGEYWVLPPEEKRIAHDAYVMYWL